MALKTHVGPGEMGVAVKLGSEVAELEDPGVGLEEEGHGEDPGVGPEEEGHGEGPAEHSEGTSNHPV